MKRARKIFVLMLSCIMLCGITQPIQAASPASLVTVRTDFSDTSVPYAVPVLQYAGTGDTVIPDVVLIRFRSHMMETGILLLSFTMETSQIFLPIRLVFLQEHPFWKEEAQRHGPVFLK